MAYNMRLALHLRKAAHAMTSLRLAYSQKNSTRSPRSGTNSERSQTLSLVPFKMLPVASLDDWRIRRLMAQLDRLAVDRPIAFGVIERWVDRLCEEDERVQASSGGA
jgi:hypothetical protein